MKSEALYAFDLRHSSNAVGHVAGLDEAGRGPVAGPVVAAAVVLDLTRPIEGINDSKKLTAAVRDRLYSEITSSALAWAVGIAGIKEIERVNILNASLGAMKSALASIAIEWRLALVDGNQRMPDVSNQLTVIRGDSLSASIAAASILAKVTRDRIMVEEAARYPQYGFEVHKGYATAKHIEALRRFGLCPIHRPSFCERLVAQVELPLDTEART